MFLQTWLGLSRIEHSSQQQESAAKSSELQKDKRAMVIVEGCINSESTVCVMSVSEWNWNP